MKNSLITIFNIAKKDLLIEFRNKDVILSISGFATIIIFIFSFAFDVGSSFSSSTAGGILWSSISFASIIGINRSFMIENENNTLEGLLMAPISRDIIYLGKMIGNFIFITISEIVILPIFAILFNFSILSFEFITCCLLANIGLSVIGTLFASLSIKVRAREVLLPMLFLPCIIPILFASIEATSLIFEQKSWGELFTWFQITIAFNLIFLIFSLFISNTIYDE
ncbi:MAG: heme ABC transporter permease CcmB [Chloroflexi bacterium]|nr:heme ABC transporter permease CcmB [Chloroflexota bacterium]